MGHRALLAVAAGTDRYDCYRSQWGADGWRLAGGEGSQHRLVGDVVATDCSFASVLADHLDYATDEALFVTGETVWPYLVCWFGLPGLDGADPTDGAVVGVDPARPAVDGEFLRGWFRGTKGTVRAVVADGPLDPERGRRLLAERVRSWQGTRRVHAPPDATDGPAR